MEPDNKIRELTEKIRKEGLEKAEAEASRIREEAEKEALGIKKKAEERAAAIIDNARREAESYAERVSADLRLSARQSLFKLRNEISELLLTQVVAEPAAKKLNDPNFVSSLLLKVVENWKDCNEDVNLEVILPENMLESVEEQFRKKAADKLNNGLSLKPSKDISGGFEIKPSNGYYKISLTDEAFEEFLKENFRPIAISFLFGEGK
ncbi:MAG TPA: hypothetical protein VE870_15065 [Bacteroidales bacterium]|nr:hypothetical protein [Bacteroidales bacterium]